MALFLVVGGLVTVGAVFVGLRRRTENKTDSRPQRLGL
jgi:hypothetical protein